MNGVADGVVKLLARNPAGFVFHQQRRAAEKRVQILWRFGAARGNLPRGDGIIKIHQHLAEIEDEDG